MVRPPGALRRSRETGHWSPWGARNRHPRGRERGSANAGPRLPGPELFARRIPA
jgi:hypothetical protein